MQIQVVTPAGNVFQGEASSVTAPGASGEMGIREGHIPMISALNVGLLTIESEGSETLFAVDGGFIEVGKTEVHVVTESAIPPSAINSEEAATQLAEAKAAITDLAGLGPSEIETRNRNLRRAEILASISSK